VKMLAFGPVPSRRLGRSLGINNIPPKTCPYSCVYCQVGRTLNLQSTPQAFYRAEDILREVERKIERAQAHGERLDYLAFVPDGEPSLDLNLGREIDLLKPLGIKIAVVSNASLLWQSPVRAALGRADWVSLKIDAISEDLWHRINRPHRSLSLGDILKGMSDFSRAFPGELVTETMLTQDLNDSPDELERIADFTAGLKPAKSYVSVPTRPPAEHWVKPAGEHALNMAHQLLSARGVNAEYLIGYEGNAFAFTGDVEEDLLSITSVHPMREDAVSELLNRANADWNLVSGLVDDGKLVELTYGGNRFYTRKLLPTRKAPR